jgi:hypothetical protein
VSAGVASEAVVKDVLVRVGADAGIHQNAFGIGAVGDTSRNVQSNVGEVRLTSVEKVGPRLSKHVLHAVRDEERRDDRKAQSEPTHVQLPELSLPNEVPRSAARDRRPRHEYETDDCDDNNRRNDSSDNRDPYRNCFFDGKGESGRMKPLADILVCASELREGGSRPGWVVKSNSR